MSIADSARSIAKRGWAPLFLWGVSPDGTICGCHRGVECSSKGKHPIESKWSELPALSGADIQAMADSYPTANLGIRTGWISGIFVVDVDAAGKAAWDDLVDTHGLPVTLVVQTGSGMRHYYFKIPQGVKITNSRGSLPAGIDVRGDGGQVVAPPSRTDKGPYLIMTAAPVQEPFPWLLEMILAAPRRTNAPLASAPVKEVTEEGRRKTAAMVAKWAKELAGLPRPWREGAGWDEMCWVKARDFVALANSPWSPLTMQKAFELYLQAAPFDSAWDQRAQKWARAVADCAREVKDPPRTDVLGMVTTPAQPNPEPTGDAEGLQIAGDSDSRDTDSKVIAQFCNEALLGRARYNPLWGWHVWSGKIWAECKIQVIEELFRLWVRDKVAQAGQAGDADGVKFYVKYLSGSRATVPVARCRGAMTVYGETVPTFDQHPHLLTVGNGVVDLRTGALLPFSPHYMMTKMTSVPYVPDAAHEDWASALSALPPRVVDWMQVRMGQAVTGSPTWDDVVLFLHGSGQNGKTALMVGVTKALGGHAVLLSEKVLSASSQEHTTDLTDLRGARLALLEETPEGSVLNTKRLKDIAGTPTIQARRMRENNVSWPSTHSMFVTTNHVPQIRETEHGTWRRLALVSFKFRYLNPGEVPSRPDERIGDRGLRHRLEAGENGRHEAVLAWLVAGARRWYEQGGIGAPSWMPAEVAEATSAWRWGSDRIGAWIEERIEFDPDACVSSQEAFADFTAFLHSQGAREWAENTFAERLGGSEHAHAHQLKKRRVNYRGSLGMSRRNAAVHRDFEDGQKVTVWEGMKFLPPATQRTREREHLVLLYND